MIDAGVGRMIAALEHTGQADDTIVVFTSDHGDMFGDHGFMLKGGMVFEGTTRVPLIVARPEAARDALLGQIPLSRLGQPEEIASAVAFLASPGAGYITGETLHVNGGMYMA